MSSSTDPEALSRSLQHAAAREDRKGGAPRWSLEALRQSGLLTTAAPADRSAAAGTLPRSLHGVGELAEVDGSIAEIFGGHVVANVLRALAGLRGSEPPPLRASGPVSGDTRLVASHSGEGFILRGEVAGFAGGAVADRLVLAFRDGAGDLFIADIPADAAGIARGALGERIGQRQAASAPLSLDGVRIEAGGAAPLPAPDAALAPLLLAAVRVHLLAGIARGAVGEGKLYTVSKSRPWVYSGYEKHTDDPFVQRRYGDLYIRSLAATELADRATGLLVAALSAGTFPSAELVAALDAAELWAGETALAVGAGIFEVMGARSATRENGYDRFWRNARTISLDHPPAPRQTAIGDWLLGRAGGEELQHGQA